MALGVYIYARAMTYRLKRDDDRFPRLETLEETPDSLERKGNDKSI